MCLIHKKWIKYDNELYNTLYDLVISNKSRSVYSIEYSNLFRNTAFYSDYVPQDLGERNEWLVKLIQKANAADFVFFDPDIGIEIPSVPDGTKRSPMYLYWREIEMVWNLGKSLLIYQHFRRENRDDFIDRMLKELKNHTPTSFVDVFKTGNVAFLLALQPEHKDCYDSLAENLDRNWEGQIVSINPNAPKVTPVKGQCPNCSSNDIGRIVYGMPGADLAMSKDVLSGKIILGGCCIEIGAPTHRCNDCMAYIFKGWKKYEFRDEY